MNVQTQRTSCRARCCSVARNSLGFSTNSLKSAPWAFPVRQSRYNNRKSFSLLDLVRSNSKSSKDETFGISSPREDGVVAVADVGGGGGVPVGKWVKEICRA